jgi:hypothetical protein
MLRSIGGLPNPMLRGVGGVLHLGDGCRRAGDRADGAFAARALAPPEREDRRLFYP